MQNKAKPRGKPFKKGEGGRKKGSTNKVTRTVKQTVLAVFNELQEDPKTCLSTWAKSNLKDYYLLAAKLIPTEVEATVTEKVIKVVRE